MAQALRDLLTSSHGLFGLTLIVAATVLAGIGKMTVDQWTSFTEIIFASFVGGQAVMTAAKTHTEGKVEVARALMPKRTE